MGWMIFLTLFLTGLIYLCRYLIVLVVILPGAYTCLMHHVFEHIYTKAGWISRDVTDWKILLSAQIKVEVFVFDKTQVLLLANSLTDRGFDPVASSVKSSSPAKVVWWVFCYMHRSLTRLPQASQEWSQGWAQIWLWFFFLSASFTVSLSPDLGSYTLFTQILLPQTDFLLHL